MKRTYLAAGGAALALAAGGAGIAQAVRGDDEGGSVTGPAADKAKAAALQITHGGTVNAVERDSENGATWEVEVTKPNGKTVDVRLDAGYGLVIVDGDSERGDREERGEGARGAGNRDDREEHGDREERGGDGEEHGDREAHGDRKEHGGDHEDRGDHEEND